MSETDSAQQTQATTKRLVLFNLKDKNVKTRSRATLTFHEDRDPEDRRGEGVRRSSEDLDTEGSGSILLEPTARTSDRR